MGVSNIKVLRRVIQSLICLVALSRGASYGNTYVLDGNPTGLVSSAGAGSFSGATYSAGDSGENTFAHGPAKFKYVWQKSSTVPEDAPLTVIFHVQTLAMVWGAGSGSTASNGYSNAFPAAVLWTEADEYVVRPGGTNVEFTLNPSATTGANSQGFCSVSMTVNVIPVTVALTGITWIAPFGPIAFGQPPPPKAPNILVGEKTISSISAGGLGLSGHTWTIPGDNFLFWNSGRENGETANEPNFQDGTHVEKNLPVSSWRWKAMATAIQVVSCASTVAMPSNVHNPVTASVTDEYKVTVVRPGISAFEKVQFPYGLPLQFPPNTNTGTGYMVTTLARIRVGMVLRTIGFTPGGQYCFGQKLVTSTSFPLTDDWPANPVTNKLDKTFPYSIEAQTYALNGPPRFEDAPDAQTDEDPAQLPLEDHILSNSDHFEITLFFKAATAEANWVPLQVSTWRWYKRYNVPSVLADQESTAWLDTVDYPTWVGVYGSE